MSTVVSNNYLYLKMTKKIDFSADVFKIILMNGSFIFNRATMDGYADVVASELPTASGYTVGGATLSGITLTRDNVLNLVSAVWSNVSWNATGTLTSNGAIIYDDTVANDPVVGYIDFGGTQVTYAAGTATIANPTVVDVG